MKGAEEEYAYAQQIGWRYTKYTTLVEGKRHENLKKINEELNKQNGTTGMQYVSVTDQMGRAGKESYKALQDLSYVENHRVENTKNLKKYQEDYNTTLTDYEIALQKIADPRTSGWDKLGAMWDKEWAAIRIRWIEFWQDPFANINMPADLLSNFMFGGSLSAITGGGSVTEAFYNNIQKPLEDAINGGAASVGAAWDSFWQPITDFFNGLTVDNSWDLADLFHFDVPDLKGMLEDGWSQAVSGVQSILDQEGSNWSSWGRNAGSKTVSSIKGGLSQLAQMMRNRLEEGRQAIISKGNEWKTQAYNNAKGIYDSVKNGIGDLAGIVKGKLDEVVQKIRNAKDDLANAASEAANAILNPFSWIKLPFGFGTYGPRPSVRRRTSNNVHRTPLYGSNDVSFETALRGMLTAQGFRSASSYQYYPNSRQTVSETWNSGKSNCYDGANLIVSLANMFGLKGHIVAGTWNGTGHAAAVVGGKLYDMTQFQKRGTFRGTPGVHFGGGGSRAYGDNNISRKEINVNVDLSNAKIYGIDDLDNHIRKSAEGIYYELNSPDKARGY